MNLDRCEHRPCDRAGQAVALMAVTLSWCVLLPAAIAESSDPTANHPEPLRIKPVPGWTLVPTSVRTSPDGQHVAYRLTKNEVDPDLPVKQRIVWDGQPHRIFDDIVGPTFSPDSQRLVYFADTVYGWRLFVDGKEQPCLEPRSEPVFTPDSKHVVYWAGRGDGVCLVLDGRRQADYDAAEFRTLAFSPDSRHVAYLARRKSQWLLVVDGHEYPLADKHIRQISFSADSQQVYIKFGQVR